MVQMTNRSFILKISGALLALMLLLSACNAATIVPTQVPTATQLDPVEPAAKPTATSLPTEAAPTPTSIPTQTPVGTIGQNSIFMDFSSADQGITAEIIAAVTSTDGPWWMAMPEYTRLTLKGYQTGNSTKTPQILVFPVNGLGVNDTAAKIAASLQTLLQDQQAGKDLPFLPLSADTQIMHAQVQYVDFKNGTGVRYLTQFSNGIAPINNQTLFYTYQALSSDGKYYVAAVLPVSLQGLPANTTDTTGLPSDFPNDYTNYLSSTINLLDQNPAAAYSPDLSKLDVMMQSIEIK